MSQNTIHNKIILPLVTLVEAVCRTFAAFVSACLRFRYRGIPSIGNCNDYLHGCCCFISCKPTCYSACQLSFRFDADYSFFPFLYLGKTLTRNSLGQISKTKLLESFDLVFLPAIQELTQYFILASLCWALALAPLFAVLYFVFKKLITLRLQTKFE